MSLLLLTEHDRPAQQSLSTVAAAIYTDRADRIEVWFSRDYRQRYWVIFVNWAHPVSGVNTINVVHAKGWPIFIVCAKIDLIRTMHQRRRCVSFQFETLVHSRPIGSVILCGGIMSSLRSSHLWFICLRSIVKQIKKHDIEGNRPAYQKRWPYIPLMKWVRRKYTYWKFVRVGDLDFVCQQRELRVKASEIRVRSINSV